MPQGSALRPVIFNIYTLSLSRLLRKHLPQYHTNLYMCVKPSALMVAKKYLEDCIAFVQTWMDAYQLKMNKDKTEFLTISSNQSATKISPLSFTIGDLDIKPATKASGLFVLLDAHATIEAHVNNICKAAFSQLHSISKLRRCIDQSSLETIVHAFITSRLDYCNVLLCGLPGALVNKLQRVQNVTVRILTGTPRHASITPVLGSLHRLPIVLLLIYKVLKTPAAPVYLKDLIKSYAHLGPFA